MNRHLLSYIFLVAVTAILVSCAHNGIDSDDVVPGQPAMLRISINSGSMTDVDTKGLIESQEKKINQVIVLVFYPNGDLVSRTELTDLDDSEVIDAYAVTGMGMTIYAVANYDENIRAKLMAVSDLDELKSIEFSPVKKDLTTLEKPENMIMVGSVVGQIIKTGTNNVDINLQYIAAKLTIKIIDNTSGQLFNVRSWRVVNAPVFSYLVPHGDSDCLDPSDDSQFAASNPHPFELSVQDDEDRNTYSESLYILENYRGGRKSGVPKPSGVLDEIWNGFRGKSACAPDHATYIEVAFTALNAPSDMSKIFGIERDGLTYNFTARYYFGHNTSDDYNITRGSHYIWTVIIHDNWDIKDNLTENNSNVDGNSSPLSIKTSSSLNFDSHPDMRAIDITANRDNISNLSVEVIDMSGRHFYDTGFDATWLKISPMNRMRSQISQRSPDNLWQQQPPVPGAEGYYVRGRYIPDKARRLWLTNQPAVSATYSDEAGTVHTYSISPVPPAADAVSPGRYSPPSGVVIGSSIYPDNDNALIWSKATRRMCYKLTNMMDESKTGDQMFELFVYTDEYLWRKDKEGMQTNREAVVKVSYDNLSSGTATRENLYYHVLQFPPLYIGPIEDYNSTSAEYHDILIERMEENSIVIDPQKPRGMQNTRVMQWGYYGKNLYDFSKKDRFLNGWFLTANAVYSDVSATDASHEISDYTWSGTKFREKYGAGYYLPPTAENNYALIPEPAVDFENNGKYGNTGAPYYHPNGRSLGPGFNSVFHPVYNTTAARYCHEKNIDIDGDGIISPWETQWYLPSQSEVYMIFGSFEAIQESSTRYSSGYYWSSSESSAENAYYLGYSTGHYNINENSKMMNDPTTRNGSVRCVRRSPEVENPVLKFKDGSAFLDFSGLSQSVYTTLSKGSATGAADDNIDHSKRFVSNNAATVFVNLQIAKHDGRLDPSDPASPSKITWTQAVGYPDVFPGEVGSKTVVSRPDPRLGVGAIDLSGLSPKVVSAMGVPATEKTGCNAYYEESDKSDIGKWRLPNKRELMFMWIYQDQIVTVTDPFLQREYWSASERAGEQVGIVFDYTLRRGAWTVVFGTNAREGKWYEPSRSYLVDKKDANTKLLRCVREIFTSMKYKLVYNPNGGNGGPGTVYCYGDTPVTVRGAEGIYHPDKKTFAGWSSSPGTLTPDYMPGSTYSMGHNTAYLYAVWK